jgi:hypothetical protein
MVKAYDKGFTMRSELVKNDTVRFGVCPALVDHGQDGQGMQYCMVEIDIPGCGLPGSLEYYEPDGSILYYSLDSTQLARCWLPYTVESVCLERLDMPDAVDDFSDS